MHRKLLFAVTTLLAMTDEAGTKDIKADSLGLDHSQRGIMATS